MNAKRILQDELTRDPVAVLRAVRSGEPVVIEEVGQPSAAIVDLVDYQLLLAAIRYYVNRPRPEDPDAGLQTSQLPGLDGQSRLDTVIAYYLSAAISLSRAAELLETPWLQLRARCSRLGLPVRTGPVDAEEAQQDALVAEMLAS